MKALTVPALLLASLVAGCSFHARDPNAYREATRKVLETRSGEVRACYDAALEKNEKVAGEVVVKLTVEADTGKIKNPKIVEDDTTAPAELSECIVGQLDGLAIDPPDARQGNATFTWRFEVGG
ncbi:MAG: AgmX/PglI C-terminal domain-containing protein [Myxococcales bacterium]|jgi:hypothetical protein